MQSIDEVDKVKNIKIKTVIIIIATIVFQSLIYFITKIYQGKPYLLQSSLDDAIPFISWFIYFYILWYIMLFFVPLIIYVKSKDVFYKYMAMYLISVVICGIVFLLFPTTINRYEVIGGDFTSKLVRLIYKMDIPPVNCLPSIHCLVAMLFMYGIAKVNVKNEVKALVWVISICIIISTLFVKQHVVYDVIASFIVVCLTLLITKKVPLWQKLKKIFERG